MIRSVGHRVKIHGVVPPGDNEHEDTDGDVEINEYVVLYSVRV
jgi:hypothetical protein